MVLNFLYLCAGDVDFSATSELLTFNATTLSIGISIPILDDDIVESDEMFFGVLFDIGDPVALSPHLANVTILDSKLWLLNCTLSNGTLESAIQDNDRECAVC